MNRIEWGPWTTHGWPNLGDYIKVKTVHERTGERRVFEGLVTRRTTSCFYLDRDYGTDDWIVLRWALGKLPGEPVARKQEIEA